MNIKINYYQITDRREQKAKSKNNNNKKNKQTCALWFPRIAHIDLRTLRISLFQTPFIWLAVRRFFHSDLGHKWEVISSLIRRLFSSSWVHSRMGQWNSLSAFTKLVPFSFNMTATGWEKPWKKAWVEALVSTELTSSTWTARRLRQLKRDPYVFSEPRPRFT